MNKKREKKPYFSLLKGPRWEIKTSQILTIREGEIHKRMPAANVLRRHRRSLQGVENFFGQNAGGPLSLRLVHRVAREGNPL